MATFPTWINKNKSALNNSSNLSPRQVANKAYSLALKKLDRDDKRRRPQYTVRERLLLSNTMARAEDLLNKRTPRTNRRVMIYEDDGDVLPPSKKMAIAPPPPVAAPVIAAAIAATPIEQKQVEELKPAESIAATVTPIPTITPQIKNESPIISITVEQQMAVSLAVVAAAAYSRLSLVEQQALLSSSSHDFCRPIMIPTYSNMTSITTII